MTEEDLPEVVENMLKSPAPAGSTLPDIEDDIEDGDPMEALGVTQQKDVNIQHRPWMDYHEFVLVSTVEQLSKLVDRCLAAGQAALDLETEGLDTRVYWYSPEDLPETAERPWDPKNPPARVPQTVHKIVGYCISYDGKTGYYAPVRHTAEAAVNLDPVAAGKEIQRLCEAAQPEIEPQALELDPLGSASIKKPGKVKIYFWNAKFDQEMLFPVVGIDWWHPDSFEDGILGYFVLLSEDKALGLKTKSKQYLRVKDGKGQEVFVNGSSIPYEMVELKECFAKGREISFPELDPYESIKYTGGDAICTFLHCVRPELQKAFRDPKYAQTYRLEKQVTQVLRVMERHRIRIDQEYVRNLLDEAEAEAAGYREQIVALADQHGFHDFDPQSPKQLSEFLFASTQGLDIKPKPAKNEKSGQYKTDAATLEKLVDDHVDVNPILLTIVKYRQVEKVVGTYLRNMAENTDENGDLRYQFKQIGAATGRFSAPAGQPEHGYGGVPVHGIPSEYDPKKPKVATSLRRAFVARPGYVILKVDYSGEELRIVTNLSKEPVWYKEFTEGTGDLHTITARALFGKQNVSKQERQMGKTTNFALVYGGGVQAVMRATKCDQNEAARRKSNFDKSLPVFAGWVKTQKRRVKMELGVSTAFGRWIAIPDANDPDRAVQAGCERKSLNYPIQGCLHSSYRVLTRDGWREIGKLTAEGEFTVWTGTQWATATAANMGSCELANVYLTDGHVVRCDTRHKLLQVTDHGYGWIDYDNLTPGMAVASPLCEPVEYDQPFTLPEIVLGPKSTLHPSLRCVSDDEVWYWLGRYTGDGWFSEKGSLVFSFGCHESYVVDRCMDFLSRLGTNPTWDIQTKDHGGRSLVVSAYSVDLVRWLMDLGFKQATAHTKRIPDSVLSASLSSRKSFMCGFMDSDGNKPSVETAKGNPYNLHLCQRPLLEDTKLLLRTLGVESVIRGPYTSGTTVEGESTTSYRLYFNRRMYERQVMSRTDVRHPKFHDMFAPQFLVDNLLSKGPFHQKDFSDNATYVMYSRLKCGGKVTTYTLKRMCEMLGVALDYPIYGHKRVVTKEALGCEEDTYTLSVRDSAHRFEAEGVVHKNSGADIMKIAMVKLQKEFYRRRWHQNEVVRMMLTVHDELVFEVKYENLMEVVPVIDYWMAYPSTLAKWKVDLVSEPLIDTSWGAKYDWDMIVKGKEKTKIDPDKIKDTHIIVNDRVYDPVPDFLKGWVIPNWQRDGGTPETPPVAPQGSSTPPSSPPPLSPAPGSSLASQSPSVTSKAAQVPAVKKGLVCDFWINNLSEQSVSQVWQTVHYAWDKKNGKLLKIMDLESGRVLVDPEEIPLWIDEDKFGSRLKELNLGGR